MTKVKDTEGKPKLSLLPFSGLAEAALVREFGDNKYFPESWRQVDSKDLVDAGLRHLFKHVSGEIYDDESGYSHLSHAIASIILAHSNFFNKNLLT